jgi:hypothetical protein
MIIVSAIAKIENDVLGSCGGLFKGRSQNPPRGTNENHKHLTQDSQLSGRESYPETSDCEAGGER